ncbi:MAG TPA: hypothetical protein VM537_24610, partial [Anaerolineae bacterium]|nr:hypothetical protein [Anaerolineae bacterium]
WETNRSFVNAWEQLQKDTQGLFVICPLDLVLELSRPKAVPGGAKTSRPMWHLQVPHGMTLEEMIEAGLERGDRRVKMLQRAARLSQEVRQIHAGLDSPEALSAFAEEHGLLGDGSETRALPEGSAGAEGIETLMADHGLTREAAEQMLRSHGSMAAVYDVLGEAADATPDDGEEVIEGAYEEIDDAEDTHTEHAEHVDEPKSDVPAVPAPEGASDDDAAAEAGTEAAAPDDAETPTPEDDVPEEGGDDAAPSSPPAPAEAAQPDDAAAVLPPEAADTGDPAVPLLLEKPPKNCMEIIKACAMHKPGFTVPPSVWEGTWVALGDVKKTMPPTPANIGADPDGTRLTLATETAADLLEVWWQTTGHSEFGG